MVSRDIPSLSSLNQTGDFSAWTLQYQLSSPKFTERNVFWGGAYGNGVYVIVGEGGEIFSSENLTSWVKQKSGTIDYLSSAAFGNGQFVVLTREQSILVSPDGTNWTTRTSAQPLFQIKFVNGNFYSSGAPASLPYVSVDGLTWTQIESFWDRNIQFSAHCIAFGDSKLIAVGKQYTAITNEPHFISMKVEPVISLSYDNGTSWIHQTTALQELANIEALTYGNGRFVAVGGNGAIAVSRNGLSWTAAASGITDSLHSVAFHEGIFVAVGGKQEYGVNISTTLLTSHDGLSWFHEKSSSSNPFYGIISGGSGLVGLANRYSGPIRLGNVLVSQDGQTWFNQSISTHFRATAFGNGSFIAVGDNGKIVQSPNGLAWSLSKSPFIVNWQDAIFANGQFVVVGGHGAIAVSTNGIDWTGAETNTDLDLKAITYGNGLFVAGGGFRNYSDAAPSAGHVLLISSNAFDWKMPPKPNLFGGITDIVYGAGCYIAVGTFDYTNPVFANYGCDAMFSRDGHSWARWEKFDGPVPTGGIAFGNDRFVITHGLFPTDANRELAWKSASLAEPGTMTDWSFGQMTAGTGDNDLFALEFLDERFFATSKGRLIVSSNGAEWKTIETDFEFRLLDITFGNETFIAVGENGQILQSKKLSAEGLRLSPSRVTNGTFQVSFRTKPGASYALEFSDAPSGTNWTTLLSKSADSELMVLSDTNATSRQRFYRVREQR